MSEPRQPEEWASEDARRLWDGVMSTYDLEDGERLLLVSACRTLDELQALEAVMDGSPIIVRGSTGQDAVHPLYAAVRQHRLLLQKLLAGLIDENGESGKLSSAAGRKLALVRHHRVANGVHSA